MNNKTKTILGVALLGGVGYYMWMKSKTASFANADGCRYTLGRSSSGQSPQVYEICPGKAPRLAREVKTYR